MSQFFSFEARCLDPPTSPEQPAMLRYCSVHMVYEESRAGCPLSAGAMATNTYQLVWSADVKEICRDDVWSTPIESKLYSAASNRVAYDFQALLRSSAPGKRDLQLFLCLRGGPQSSVKCRAQARLVRESEGTSPGASGGTHASSVVFRPLEQAHSLLFPRDQWVEFAWKYHQHNRHAERGSLIASRMDLISRVSSPTRLVLHIFLEIPTHNFDVGNLLEDPEMPALLPQDGAQRPPDSEMDKTAGKLYASLLADPAGAFADYKIVSKDGAAFPVHRCVLATASEPLKVMLSSGMVEGVGDSFEIRNASSATLRHLRSFIYRGALDDSQQEGLDVGTLVELIELGQMYELSRLKAICEEEYIRLGPPVDSAPQHGPDEAHPNTFRYRLEVAARFELEQLRWYVCKCLIAGLTPENAVESLSLAKTFRLKLLHSVAVRFLYDVWEQLGVEARSELGRSAEDLMEILDVKGKSAGVSLSSTTYSNPKNIQETV